MGREARTARLFCSHSNPPHGRASVVYGVPVDLVGTQQASPAPVPGGGAAFTLQRPLRKQRL